MNKCKKCGAEFEGKICPKCGEPFEEHAPEYMRSERFILYKIMTYLPAALFLLFGVLAFIFLAAPVTKITSTGLALGAVNVGSAYKAVSAAGVNGLRDPSVAAVACAVAVIAFLFIHVVYALYYGKRTPLVYGFFVFYLAYLIIGSVMIANTASLDMGLGALAAGACPICFLVFSILFAGGTVASLVVTAKLGKAPEIMEMKAEAEQDKEARREKFGAKHSDRLFVAYAVIKFLPEVLFFLFSALAFIFLVAPAVHVTSAGILYGFSDMEYAYNMISAEGFAGLGGPVIAMLVFAVLQIVYDIFLIVDLRDQAKGYPAGEHYPSFVFYLVYLILGSVMLLNTPALDGGTGIYAAGACPICFIVFAAVFALVTGGCLVGRKVLYDRLIVPETRRRAAELA